MEIGFNQASGTSRGATTLGVDGTYKKGGFNFNKKNNYNFNKKNNYSDKTVDYSKEAIKKRQSNQEVDWDNVELGASFAPYLGEVIDAKNTIKDLRAGNYGGAALNAAGFMIPFVPGSAIKKGVNTLRKKWHNNPNPKSLLETNKTVDKVITQGKKDIEGMVTNNPNKIPVSNISGSNITNKGDIGNLGPYKRPSGRDLVDVEISPGTNVQMYRSTGGGNKYFADGRTSQGFYSPYLGSMDGTLNTSRGTRFIPDWQVKTKGWDKGYGSKYVENLGHQLKNIDETETLTEINKIVDKGGPISPAFDPTEQHPFIYRKKGGFNWEPPTLKKSMEWDELLRRQRFQESSFDHDAYNEDSGATGVAQIMPNTLEYAKMKGWVPKSTTMEDVKKFDVGKTIQVNYMNNLIDRDWIKGSEKVKRAKALIAYNWGPDNTRKYLNKLKKKGIDIYSDDLSWLSHFNEESRNYVGRILLNEGDFEKQYTKGLTTNIPLKKRKGGFRNSKMLYNKAKRKK